MNMFKQILPVGSAILLFASSVDAQIQNPVVSDSAGNTAMGTGALTTIQNPYCDGDLDSDACENTAAGSYTIHSLTTGSFNTALGYAALDANSSGNFNTASGYKTLVSNSSGEGNTATGFEALIGNSTGSENTATGMYTLYSNNTGNYNTATGHGALYYNSSGSYNTATGYGALSANTTGGDNSGFGDYALQANTTGAGNVAIGHETLHANINGSYNMAAGFEALYKNTSGGTNTAVGRLALFSNTSGTNNIAFGNNAGYNLTSGSNNIDVGAEGTAGESNTIRIGTSGTQTTAYVAGIENSKITGAAVYVTASGQLGVLASSERYKTEIKSMGSSVDKLKQLRPVTFHLKNDPQGSVQYGLIAEEVDRVYPELVIRDANGVIQGVRYDELAPMLLKTVQDQNTTVARLRTELEQHHADMARRQASTDRQLAMLTKQNEAMQAVMLKMQTAMTQQVAMR